MSASASARDADDAAILLRIRKETGADCDHLSASQKDLLARAHCIGTGGVEEEEEEAEVFSTPPLTQQDPLRQGQSQQGQAGDGEDGIAMCSMPFTQTQLSSPSSVSSDSRQRKPTRKVRAGTTIWPPTATATAPAPAPPPATATATATASPSPELDPLVRMVLMVPTAPLPTTGHKNILELARSRGIFDHQPPGSSSYHRS